MIVATINSLGPGSSLTHHAHARVRVALTEQPSALDLAHPWHANIDNDNVRLVCSSDLERLFPTEGFADDLQPLITREKRLERLEERGIVVDEQDTNR